MPDAAGNIKGIAVPELPLSMQRCTNSGLTKPECCCPDCAREMLAKQGKSAS